MNLRKITHVIEKTVGSDFRVEQLESQEKEGRDKIVIYQNSNCEIAIFDTRHSSKFSIAISGNENILRDIRPFLNNHFPKVEDSRDGLILRDNLEATSANDLLELIHTLQLLTVSLKALNHFVNS